MDATPMKLELVPIESADDAVPPPAVPDASSAAESVLDAIEILAVDRPIPISDGPAVKVNPYVSQAAREYAEGQVDNALWDRALAQTNGDKTAAAAVYVRARATALRLFARRGRQPSGRSDLPIRETLAERAVDNGSLWSRFRYPIIGAAVLVPLLAGGLIFAFHRADPTPEATEVSAPASVAARSPARPVKAVAAPGPATSAPKPITTLDLGKRVQEFRDAGNWNLLVLFAVEWTRKDPTNAAAWDALRSGYAHLRQYDDAASAASKAVQLAPDEQKLWRRLGEASLDIDDPAAALAAFEQAAARNEHDIDSLQQIGMLNVRLGRPQDAKAAFDRAQAANPHDATTGCLRATVAQITARDAYTLSREVKAADARCHGRNDAVAAK
jgi:tetratricopeptide (TPR) repeat protein